MDDVLRRRRWIVHRRLEGWKVADIAEALRVSEKTVDRWCSVHRKYGWKGLAVKSHAPRTIHRTPQATVDLVLKLRREKHWGPCKIEGYLKKHCEGTTPVSHTAIYRILVEAGLNNPIAKPRRVWGKRRFEREYSNSLWQADFKLTGQDEWMVSFLDDHSRFVPGSEIHHNPTGEHAIQLLEASIVKYGKPCQILTDRGTQFYPARGETSAFTEFCSGNGIEYIVASIRRPSTIGKIEAFQSLQIRGLDVPKPSTIRELLELREATSRNKLLIPSRRILQRSRERDTSLWIEQLKSVLSTSPKNGWEIDSTVFRRFGD